MLSKNPKKKDNFPVKKISSDKDVGLFKNLIDVLPGGVFIKNESGKYLLVNKYVDDLVSKRGDTLVGKYDSEFFPKEVYDKLWKVDKALLKSSTSRVVETVERIPTKKGDRHLLTKKQVFPNLFENSGRMILAATTDITELKEIQDELNSVNSLLRKVTQLIPDIVFLFDLDTKEIDNSNIAFHRMLGYTKKQVEYIPEFWCSIMHPDDKLSKQKLIGRLRSMSSTQVIKFEGRYRKLSGDYLWTNTIITPFSFSNKGVEKVLVAIEDIHKIKKLQQKYEKESYYDHLTKIYNRRYFMKMISKTLSREKPFTLLFVDLDKFKQVNDEYGHDVGDKLLIETSKKLKSIFRRKSDIVARLGGDEFVIMISGQLGDKINCQIPGKLRSQFITPYKNGKVLINYRPSIGGVYIDSNYDMKPEDILHQADQAMYKAKRRDSLDIVFFSECCGVNLNCKCSNL